MSALALAALASSAGAQFVPGPAGNPPVFAPGGEPKLPDPKLPSPELPYPDVPRPELPNVPERLPIPQLPGRDLPGQPSEDQQEEETPNEDQQRDYYDELTRQLMQQQKTPLTSQPRQPAPPLLPGTTTRETPRSTPRETPEPPIGLTPPPPPVYGEELENPDFCCGKKGTAITFPIITDPMEITTQPIAPWDVAVGAFQVLLDRAAFFLNELDLSVPALAFPIEWKRHYLSDVEIMDGGLIGYGWDFSYNKRIVPMANHKLANGLYLESESEDARLAYYDGQGRGEIYVETHSETRNVDNFDARFQAYVTTYRSPPGQFHEIERYIVLGSHENHPFKEHPDVEPTEQIFYVLREKNGTRLVFNCRGQMIYVLSRNDSRQNHVRVELRYGGPPNPLTQNRLLSEIRDAKNRVFSITPTFINQASMFTNIRCKLETGTYRIPRIKSISGAGYQVEYTYSGQPILTQVKVTTGDVAREWRYTYDDEHRLTEARDPVACAEGDSGKPYIINTYNDEGQVTAQNLAGIPMRLAYLPGRVTVTAADNSSKDFELEKIGPYTVTRAQTIRAAGGQGGGPWITRFQHNAATQVTRVTFPKGNGVSYEYDEENGPITEGPFKDWLDRNLVYESDLSAGNLLKVTTLSANASDKPVTTTSTYEPLYNQVKTSTDARGGLIAYDYSFVSPRTRGNPIRVVYPSFERPDGSMVMRPPETFAYNADGQRTTADAGDRRMTIYRYNNFGYLQGIQYPSGAQLEYQLSPRGEIMRESGTNVTVSYKRDGRGLMTEKIIDPGGAKVRSTYRYDLNGNPVEVHTFIKDVFNPSSAKMAGITAGAELDRGVVTTYDALGRVLTETVSAERLTSFTKNEYDNLGMMVAKTVPALSGNGTTTTRFAYDARGQVISTVEAADTPVALTTKIARDLNGNETRIEVSGGGQSAATVNEHDGFDRLISSKNPLGAETKYTYEPGGKVASVEVSGSKGPGAGSGVLQRTTSEYDVYGNLIHKSVDTLVNGSEESFLFYNDRLLLERAVAPNGGETTFEYDLDNRVTKTIDPAGNETVTTYNPRGQATRITQTVTEQVDDAKTGRAVGRKKSYVTTQEFDPLGHVVSVLGPAVNQRFFYNSADQMRGMFNAGEGLTTFTYDGLGRRESIRNGDNFELTSYTAGGLVRETDGLAAHQAFEYDALGRTTRITDQNTNTHTTIVYDGLGRETERTDPNGTVIKKKLDAGGLPETVTVTPAVVTVQAAGRSASGIGGLRFENFEYDALGRTVRARTSEQAEVRFVYDGLDRAIEETQIFRSYGQTLHRRFASDATWREIDYPEITGRPTVRYSYDVLGRTEQVELNDQPMAVYSYTGADRVFRKLTGNGVETRYAFDDETRTTQIRISSPASANGSAGGAIWSTSARYRGTRPSAVTETLHVPAGGVAPRNLMTELRYDRAGRVLFASTEAYTLPQRPMDAADHVSTSISTFERGRLMSAVDYVEDGFGKVQNIRLDSFTYGPGPRVASVSSTGSARPNATLIADDMARARQLAEEASGSISRNQSFLYDNNGNVLYDGRFMYAYDYKGRLVRVEDTWHPYNYDDSLTFYYDSFDRRVYLEPARDRVPEGLVRFGPEWDRHDQWHLYDGNKLIAETWVGHPRAAQAVSLLARYFFGARDGERIRMDRRPEADPRGPFSTFYFHEDLQGQIKLLTNGAGQPTVARNVNSGPGAGEAPTRPPEDAVMIAGTSVRMPYSSGATRLDGFAAVVYREDVGRALLNYRAAHAWGREVEAGLLRDAIASYQNRMLAVLGGITAIPIAAPYAVAYAGGEALLTSAIIGGGLNLGLNAGTAIYTQSGYTLAEGVGNFASGAINGMTGSVANAAARGIVQEVLLDYASNVALDTYSSAVVDGQSWKDAFAGGLVSGAYSSALGFGVARVGEGLHWAGRQASARLNVQSGAIRADAPRATEGVPARVYNSTYINGRTTAELRKTDLYLAKDIVPVGRELKNFEMQVISLLLRGTKVSQEIARRLMNGTWEVRVSKFQAEQAAYAQFHKATPNLLHVNSGLTMIDPRTGARFNILQSPLMFAGLLVHEGIHALGGGELTAHTAQAQFLTAHVNRPARRGLVPSQNDVPLLDSGHLDLIHAWKEQSITKVAEFIAGLEAEKGRYWYDPADVRVTDYNSGDAWVRAHAGGWAEFMGLENNTLFTAIEAKTRASSGHFKNGVNLGAMP